MYKINNESFQVRLCRTCISNKNVQVPFQFLDGGWHRCKEPYHIDRPHGYEGYLLFFSVTEGGQVRIKDTLYEISAASITILPPNTSHEYYTGKDQWWEFYWLHTGAIHMEILEEIIKTCGFVFKSPRAVQMGRLIESLFPERFTTDESMYEIAASQVISQILHMMLEDMHHITSSKYRQSGIVSAIIKEIEVNYASDINIIDLAAQNYISVQHMIRLFKQNTGYTPYEYLKKYRLQKAGEMLVYSNLSVAEIAAQTGFLNVNNFIFQFKKEYKMTPGNYRK